MKKTFMLLALVAIVIGSLLMSSCGETASPTPSPTPTPTPTPSPTPTPTPTGASPIPTTTSPTPTPTPTEMTPVHGGTLRILTVAGPTALGGFRGGPGDLAALFPGIAAYMNTTSDRSQGNGLEPELANVTEDLANKKLHFEIFPGTLFHDGSELTAEVAVWNLQRTIDAGRLQYFNYFDHYEVTGTYTFDMYFTEYTNQLIHSWAWSFPRSMEAFMNAVGDATPEEQTEWDENHIVGPGPFKFVEYVRESHMYWERFDDYFRADEGLPYLDRIEYIYIPEAVTAKAQMRAGDADYWMGASARDQLDLEAEGFVLVKSWPGLVYNIWPNTSDPDSVFNDVNLRYAVEYAIDKAAIAQTIGAGLYVPLYQNGVPGEWGYDPNYPERRYDPDKAREYMALAGKSQGFATTLTCSTTQTDQDVATAIKQYLGDVGIDVTIDAADPSRFGPIVYGVAQPGLLWSISGMDVTNLLTYMRWFSTDPFANVSYLGHTEEQRMIDEDAKSYPDAAGQKAATERAFKYLNDGAWVIPVYQVPATSVSAPYVHAAQGLHQYTQGFVRWRMELLWMEPH